MKWIVAVGMFLVGLVVYSGDLVSSQLKTSSQISYSAHLRSADVCKSIEEKEIALSEEDLALAHQSWQRDIEGLERKLDQILKEKGSLIKIFLWARERRLQAFPSGLILKNSEFVNTKKRLKLLGDIAESLHEGSLLKHILRREMKSFDPEEGVGAYNGLLAEYVNSLIMASAPRGSDFSRWLAESCAR